MGTDADGGATGARGRVRVLAVDDEPDNLRLLERTLRREYDVLAAASGEEALELLAANADVAHTARLLFEGRRFASVDLAFASTARPSVPEALGRLRVLAPELAELIGADA